MLHCAAQHSLARARRMCVAQALGFEPVFWCGFFSAAVTGPFALVFGVKSAQTRLWKPAQGPETLFGLLFEGLGT